MKIAILSPFYPFRGGMAQFSTRLYQELQKHFEVKAFNFITLYPSLLFPGKTQYVEVTDNAVAIDNDRVLSSINPYSYYSSASKINKYQPDILIIPYWMSFLAPSLGILSRFLDKKIKIVGLIHNAIPHEKKFFDKPFAKFFFSKCDGFICLSDLVADDLRYLVSDKPIIVSSHPIYDHYNLPTDVKEARKILSLDSDKNTLLFFGLIRQYKGLDLLIEAMSLLDDSYQLLIAGECYGDFKLYQDLINKSPYKTNIKVLEQYISDTEVSVLFSSADVLVLPYRDATQSGVIAVAYQLETPIIATNIGALGKTVREGGTGIVVDDITPQAIATGVKQFFQDPEAKDRYKMNLQSEKKRLSWSSFVETLTPFFNSL